MIHHNKAIFRIVKQFTIRNLFNFPRSINFDETIEQRKETTKIALATEQLPTLYFDTFQPSVFYPNKFSFSLRVNEYESCY